MCRSHCCSFLCVSVCCCLLGCGPRRLLRGQRQERRGQSEKQTQQKTAFRPSNSDGNITDSVPEKPQVPLLDCDRVWLPGSLCCVCCSLAAVGLSAAAAVLRAAAAPHRPTQTEQQQTTTKKQNRTEREAANTSDTDSALTLARTRTLSTHQQVRTGTRAGKGQWEAAQTTPTRGAAATHADHSSSRVCLSAVSLCAAPSPSPPLPCFSMLSAGRGFSLLDDCGRAGWMEKVGGFLGIWKKSDRGKQECTHR